MELSSYINIVGVWGAWGGYYGKRWDDGTFTGVREIKLVYGLRIDSILVVYDKQGQPFKAEKHGGVEGKYTAEIKLEYPDEFLISVSGHYAPSKGSQGGGDGDGDGDGGDTCIRSLTFKSNRRTFGPYGVEEGTRFNFSSYPIFEIVGFHGRSGEYLHQFGLYASHAKPRNLLPKDVTQKSFVVGPWGGTGGTDWDDGAFTGVRSIALFYGDCIYSISVVYDDHGRPFKTEKHGGDGGSYIAEIMLQYPVEYLVEVSGLYGPIDGLSHIQGVFIRSLTFETNLRIFGPYGFESGTPFTLPTHGRRILGFKGQSAWLLNAIGFHLSGIM